MIAFTLAIFFLIITPGPGVLTTAGVGSSFGYHAGIRYVGGLLIGNNLVSLAVVTGVEGVMLSLPGLRQLLLVLSVAYLFYLAARIALSGSQIKFIEASKSPGLIDGVVLQLINPKAYVVATTLFSGFPFKGQEFMLETILKFIIMNIVWLPIHLLWLWAGCALKKLALSAKQQRTINMFMGLSLLIVVALALLASPVVTGTRP